VGALLAVLVLRTRSVVPAILLHLGYNAILVLGDRFPGLADPRLAWLGLAVPCLLWVRPRPNAASR
jgi:membrane protease YdiL (CAAX protease family)